MNKPPCELSEPDRARLRIALATIDRKLLRLSREWPTGKLKEETYRPPRARRTLGTLGPIRR